MTQALQPKNQLGTCQFILSPSHSWVGLLPPHLTVTCVHAGALLSLDDGYSLHGMGPATCGMSIHWPAGPASRMPSRNVLRPWRLPGRVKGLGLPGARQVGRQMDVWQTDSWTCLVPPQLSGATCQSWHTASPGAGCSGACNWPASPPAFPGTLGRRPALCLPPSMPQSWYAPWLYPSLECLPVPAWAMGGWSFSWYPWPGPQLSAGVGVGENRPG